MAVILWRPAGFYVTEDELGFYISLQCHENSLEL